MGADVSADSEIPAALASAAAEVKRLTWRSAACATSVSAGTGAMRARLSLHPG
jgi:hypothetical protein